MNTLTTPLLQELSGVVGQAHVLHGSDLSAYEVDWRKRWRGRALAVVRPSSTAEVAQVVRVCAAHGVSIVPQGGNTGLVGGGVPDASGTQVVLSLQRMQRIRTLDSANLTLTVEAGCILQTVQETARQAGLLFPLSLAAEGSCTIGGNLATNAGGTQVLRYGNARDLCLGVEVVTAQGDIWDGLSGLRKDNTGYDLRGLMVGSEGTLGIITAATLKLFPAPRSSITALASCSELADAVRLLAHAQSHLDATLTGFEVMNRFSLDLVARHFPQLPRLLPGTPWTVLIEQSDTRSETLARETLEAMLSQALELGLIDDVVLAENLAQSHAMWHLRESIPLAQAEEGLNVKHDISLPISAIAEFVATTDSRLQTRFDGVRLVNFGHLGDGNLHYNVQAPSSDSAASFLRDNEEAVNDIVYEAVRSFGGSISAEHGVGQLKRDCLPRYKAATALAMMGSIKSALDPQGILNPARVLPADAQRSVTEQAL